MITLWRCYRAIETMVVLRWCYDGNMAELLLRAFTAMPVLFPNLSLQVSLWLVKVLSCSEVYSHTNPAQTPIFFQVLRYQESTQQRSRAKSMNSKKV